MFNDDFFFINPLVNDVIHPFQWEKSEGVRCVSTMSRFTWVHTVPTSRVLSFLIFTFRCCKLVQNDRTSTLFNSGYRGPHSDNPGPSYKLRCECILFSSYFTVVSRFSLQLSNRLDSLYSDCRFVISCKFYVGKLSHMSLPVHWIVSYSFTF